MITITFGELSSTAPVAKAEPEQKGMVHTVDIDNEDSEEHEFLEHLDTKASELGLITNGKTKHFYTRGAFDLVDLVVYVLKQTGAAHVFVSSYGIASDTIRTLKKCVEVGKILSIRFLLDNRVRSISPKPFDAMVRAFPGNYRLNSVHAKCALVWNDEWHISIIGSQNATHNPKLERDTIYTDPRIWEFDRDNLELAYSEGTT